MEKVKKNITYKIVDVHSEIKKRLIMVPDKL